MARDEKRRQRKLMKKRRKDQLRRKARERQSAAGLERNRIAEAERYPIHECLIGSDWHERGLAHIVLSRVQPDGNLVVGSYLVDVFCLGLKDTFARANLPKSTYKTELRDRLTDEGQLETCPMEVAHTIIYGGIEYARQFGFRPHHDFKLSHCVLGQRDPSLMGADVEFGKDGRPFYIAGPHDDVRKTIRQLQAAAGEGNFDFVAPGPDRTGNAW